ncbi:MAG: hypothetical protein ETSY2_55150, partial [Candidatus Entotheonella gemina]
LICDDVLNFLRTSADQSFDVVVLSHVLEHLDNPQAFLSTLSQISKYFYIEVPDFESSHLNLYRSMIKTDLNYTDNDHVSEFDRRELADIIKQAGLAIEICEFSFGVMRYWCRKANDSCC